MGGHGGGKSYMGWWGNIGTYLSMLELIALFSYYVDVIQRSWM